MEAEFQNWPVPLEAILKLRAARLDRPGPDRKPFGGVVLIMKMVAVVLKIVDFAPEQFAEDTADLVRRLREIFQSFEGHSLLPMAQLVQDRLHPGTRLFGLGIEIPGHFPQVFGGVIKIQFLDGALETIFDDVPNPNRAIAHNENMFGVCHAPSQGFGMHVTAKFFGRSARRSGHPVLLQYLAARPSRWIGGGNFDQLIQSVDDGQFEIAPFEAFAGGVGGFESPILCSFPAFPGVDADDQIVLFERVGSLGLSLARDLRTVG